MPNVAISESLELGISDDLKEYYRKKAVIYRERQEQVIRPIKTDKREVVEVFKESIPFPELWPYGQPRNFQTFRDRKLTLQHRNWNLAIPYLRWDQEDEVIKGDLEVHLQGMADRMAQIPDQLVADELQQTATLGQALTTAYDGVAIFSATDGDSADRFQVSGGNRVESVGLQNEADVLENLLNVQTRLLEFKDTEGQPFFDAGEVDESNFIVVCSPALQKIFRRAREAKFTLAQANTNFPTENILVGNFDLWVNQRVTSTTSFYVLLKHDFYKPFIGVERSVGPEIDRQDRANSDQGRINAIYAMMAVIRYGLATFSPQAAVEVFTA